MIQLARGCNAMQQSRRWRIRRQSKTLGGTKISWQSAYRRVGWRKETYLLSMWQGATRLILSLPDGRKDYEGCGQDAAVELQPQLAWIP